MIIWDTPSGLIIDRSDACAGLVYSNSIICSSWGSMGTRCAASPWAEGSLGALGEAVAAAAASAAAPSPPWGGLSDAALLAFPGTRGCGCALPACCSRVAGAPASAAAWGTADFRFRFAALLDSASAESSATSFRGTSFFEVSGVFVGFFFVGVAASSSSSSSSSSCSPFSTRFFIVLFQWFLIALSVLPGRYFAISAQRLPYLVCASSSFASSSSVQLSRRMSGLR